MHSRWPHTRGGDTDAFPRLGDAAAWGARSMHCNSMLISRTTFRRSFKGYQANVPIRRFELHHYLENHQASDAFISTVKFLPGQVERRGINKRTILWKWLGFKKTAARKFLSTMETGTLPIRLRPFLAFGYDPYVRSPGYIKVPRFLARAMVWQAKVSKLLDSDCRGNERWWMPEEGFGFSPADTLALSL